MNTQRRKATMRERRSTPPAARGLLRADGRALVEALNGPWHKAALQVFLAVVLAHWVEHVLQALQIFALHWPRPEARGALGLVFPWLVSSEALHYGYALVM